MEGDCNDLICAICKKTKLHVVHVDGSDDTFHCPGRCHERYLRDEKDRRYPELLERVKELQENWNKDRKKLKRLRRSHGKLAEDNEELVRQNEGLRAEVDLLKASPPDNNETSSEAVGSENGLESSDTNGMNDPLHDQHQVNEEDETPGNSSGSGQNDDDYARQYAPVLPRPHAPRRL